MPPFRDTRSFSACSRMIRVNTRNLLQRRSFHLPSYNCELCDVHTEETALHLFWDSSFALNCWESLLGSRQRGIFVYDEVVLLLQALPNSIAMEITIMGCWNIWILRNGKNFEAKPFPVQSWKIRLRTDLSLLKHRAKYKYADLLSSWIDQVLS